MAVYYNVGGTFATHGGVVNFGTARYHGNTARINFELIYSEEYHPGTGQVWAPNANSLWRMGFRSTSNGVIYWATKGLYNNWWANAPIGNYTISAQRYNNSGALRDIRFSGHLTI